MTVLQPMYRLLRLSASLMSPSDFSSTNAPHRRSRHSLVKCTSLMLQPVEDNKQERVKNKMLHSKLQCNHTAVLQAQDAPWRTDVKEFSPASISTVWLHGSAVERQSLAGKFSLSCARPVADG